MQYCGSDVRRRQHPGQSRCAVLVWWLGGDVGWFVLFALPVQNKKKTIKIDLEKVSQIFPICLNFLHFSISCTKSQKYFLMKNIFFHNPCRITLISINTWSNNRHSFLSPVSVLQTLREGNWCSSSVHDPARKSLRTKETESERLARAAGEKPSVVVSFSRVCRTEECECGLGPNYSPSMWEQLQVAMCVYPFQNKHGVTWWVILFYYSSS